MRLWSYQHPAVLQTLQRGERYVCTWDCVPDKHWHAAFRWMGRQMAERGIPIGEHAPVWAWHSVNLDGGKPDDLCALSLLSEIQLEEGIDFFELEVPDHLALPSCYGAWNGMLDDFIDDVAPVAKKVADCFAESLRPRRGRPPQYFPDIQACLPYLEPAWLVAWETLDSERLLEKRKVYIEKWPSLYPPHQISAL